jgi:hypothetical protein
MKMFLFNKFGYFSNLFFVPDYVLFLIYRFYPGCEKSIFWMNNRIWIIFLSIFPKFGGKSKKLQVSACSGRIF